VFNDQEQPRDHGADWVYSSIADLKRDEEISRLKELVTKLSEEVNKLERIISGIGAIMGESSIRFSVVDINERSLSETKDLLIEFYQTHRGESIYPDDVACELGLDLRITMQAVKELLHEGRIEEVT
jgi:predicted Rossmann fold nucleotide-binding protein DprA/Smf involved in DNA uptake